MKTFRHAMFAFLLGWMLNACPMINENHCALNQGVCAEGAVCSNCVQENNGCVLKGTILEEDCVFSPTAATETSLDSDPGSETSTSEITATEPETSTFTTGQETTFGMSSETTEDVATQAMTTEMGSTTEAEDPQFFITYTGPGFQEFGLDVSDVTATTATLTGLDFESHLAELTVFVRKGGCEGVHEGEAQTPIEAAKIVYTDPMGNLLITDFMDLSGGEYTFPLDLFLNNPGDMKLSIRIKASGVAGLACIGFKPVPGELGVIGFPTTHSFK